MFIDINISCFVSQSRLFYISVRTHWRNEMQKIKLMCGHLFGFYIYKDSLFLVLFHFNQFCFEVGSDTIAFDKFIKCNRVFGHWKHCFTNFIEVTLELNLFINPLFCQQVQYFLRSSSTFNRGFWLCKYCSSSLEVLPVFSSFFSRIVSIN